VRGESAAADQAEGASGQLQPASFQELTQAAESGAAACPFTEDCLGHARWHAALVCCNLQCVPVSLLCLWHLHCCPQAVPMRQPSLQLCALCELMPLPSCRASPAGGASPALQLELLRLREANEALTAQARRYEGDVAALVGRVGHGNAKQKLQYNTGCVPAAFLAEPASYRMAPGAAARWRCIAGRHVHLQLWQSALLTACVEIEDIGFVGHLMCMPCILLWLGCRADRPVHGLPRT
jgi:hypothetical protein